MPKAVKGHAFIDINFFRQIPESVSKILAEIVVREFILKVEFSGFFIHPPGYYRLRFIGNSENGNIIHSSACLRLGILK